MKTIEGKTPRTYISSKNLRKINLVKLEMKVTLLIECNFNTVRCRKIAEAENSTQLNESTNEMAKLSKSGGSDAVKKIGVGDNSFSRKLHREVKRGRCEVE